MEQEKKVFVEEIPKQKKITLSILWRTQEVSLQEALKLFLFLQRKTVRIFTAAVSF